MDLIIRNGTIADGSGNPLFSADIGITGNRITAIGALTESAQTEIDASGKIVSPGFIDPHTHFDAQLLWDGAAKPAIEPGDHSDDDVSCFVFGLSVQLRASLWRACLTTAKLNSRSSRLSHSSIPIIP